MIALLLIPSWQALHPLIVHFPIALLLTAPLFILVGAFQKRPSGRTFLLAALILMLLGTACTFIAASTGEAAGRQARQTPEVRALLAQHKELAQTTEITFSALTAIFAAILLLPRLLRRDPNPVISTLLPLIFLIFYAAGAVLLVHVASDGGQLVHGLGVGAAVSPERTAAEPQAGR
ncbi:MAG TPA: DUF2231 domain-containing protein [Bryobacterales bacterium]|nr:DUF2231 domain-containing protein [Bryobacterales bacterium]